MENNNNNNTHKLSFVNILFLTFLGVMILLFKFYKTKGNFCHDSCSSINSELDIIRCLDACAINGEDFREPITPQKILSIFLIVVLLSFLLYLFINNFILRRNGTNRILAFFQWLKELKRKLFYKNVYDKFDYKKFDD